MQYIEITKLLHYYGPQSINQIGSFSNNLDPVPLKQAIEFLLESKIISEEKTDVYLTYTVTKRAIGILTFFKITPSRATI